MARTSSSRPNTISARISRISPAQPTRPTKKSRYLTAPTSLNRFLARRMGSLFVHTFNSFKHSPARLLNYSLLTAFPHFSTHFHSRNNSLPPVYPESRRAQLPQSSPPPPLPFESSHPVRITMQYIKQMNLHLVTSMQISGMFRRCHTLLRPAASFLPL